MGQRFLQIQRWREQRLWTPGVGALHHRMNRGRLPSGFSRLVVPLFLLGGVVRCVSEQEACLLLLLLLSLWLLAAQVVVKTVRSVCMSDFFLRFHGAGKK